MPYRSVFGVCLCPTGQFLRSVYALQVNFLGSIYALQVIILGSIEALQVNFWGLA